MIKYNLDKLIRVKLCDFTPHVWYQWLDEKKFLGLTIRKAGVYDKFGHYYEGTNAPENCVIKDGEVFEKPCVILTYVSDIQKVYYFDSFKEAEEFANKMTSTINWIE